MLAGGVAILKIGKFLSSDGANFLIDFLRKTLERETAKVSAAERRGALTPNRRPITSGLSRGSI